MILQKIDGFILSLYQKFSDTVQDFCGRNCFYLARLSVMLYLGVFILSRFFRYMETKDYKAIDFFLLLAILLIITPLLNRMINRYERLYLENPDILNIATKDTYKLLPVYLFLIDIYSCIIGILRNKDIFNVLENYCMLIGGFLFMSVYYFASCTPKPPKKDWVTKAKEYIKSIFAPPKLQPN